MACSPARRPWAKGTEGGFAGVYPVLKGVGRAGRGASGATSWPASVPPSSPCPVPSTGSAPPGSRAGATRSMGEDGRGGRGAPDARGRGRAGGHRPRPTLRRPPWHGRPPTVAPPGRRVRWWCWSTARRPPTSNAEAAAWLTFPAAPGGWPLARRPGRRGPRWPPPFAGAGQDRRRPGPGIPPRRRPAPGRLHRRLQGPGPAHAAEGRSRPHSCRSSTSSVPDRQEFASTNPGSLDKAIVRFRLGECRRSARTRRTRSATASSTPWSTCC